VVQGVAQRLSRGRKPPQAAAPVTVPIDGR
jgi:hypothetical protein